MVAVDKGGKEVHKGGYEVLAKLFRKGSGDPGVNGSTTDNGDGTYTVSITQESKGEHDFHVKLANKEVLSSMSLQTPGVSLILKSLPRTIFQTIKVLTMWQ